METIEFKIRLGFCDNDEKHHYIDELPDKSGLYKLHAEFNWIEVCSPDSYTDSERIAHENWNKLESGFNDDDVTMNVEYKDDGMLHVTLVAADSFNTLVPVLSKDTLIVRPLLEWVLKDINGHLSDGIGENEVAHYSGFDFPDEQDVWMKDIICDDPRINLTENNSYFSITTEPVKIITDKEFINSLCMPGYLEDYKSASDVYHSYFMDGEKLVSDDVIIAMQKQIFKMKDANIAYMLNKLKDIKLCLIITNIILCI